MVGLVFGEADGEVLDAVSYAEFFEEQDELAQFLNEPVLIFGRSDRDEHHHVDGEYLVFRIVPAIFLYCTFYLGYIWI